MIHLRWIEQYLNVKKMHVLPHVIRLRWIEQHLNVKKMHVLAHVIHLRWIERRLNVMQFNVLSHIIEVRTHEEKVSNKNLQIFRPPEEVQKPPGKRKARLFQVTHQILQMPSKHFRPNLKQSKFTSPIAQRPAGT